MQEFEIRVKGQIDNSWSAWFGGFNITHNPQGESILTGLLRDQAQLRGMLFRLADLGLDLVSVGISPRARGALNELPGGGG